jgi:hypothetical protein
MKTERELHKRNNRLANLSNRTHTNSTTLGEKASRVQKVIKKIFSTQLTAKKTCGNMPGTLCVLVIIQNSKEGVDPRAVKQITGFNTQKVHKILYKLFKHGEIRINGGGLYAGVKENFWGVSEGPPSEYPKAGGKTMHYRECGVLMRWFWDGRFHVFPVPSMVLEVLVRKSPGSNGRSGSLNMTCRTCFSL